MIASLSKSLGVPGLRLGYAYTCDARLHASLGARIPIWNLGAPAEFFLELLLKFQPELAASLERTAMDRADFADRLARVPGVAAVHAGGGNFLLARLDGEAARARRLVERLLTRDSIYVKDVSPKFPGRAPHLRLAVRRPVENQRLIDALTAHLGDPTL